MQKKRLLEDFKPTNIIILLKHLQNSYEDVDTCMDDDDPDDVLTPLPPVLHTRGTVSFDIECSYFEYEKSVFTDDYIETEYDKSVGLRMNVVIQKG